MSNIFLQEEFVNATMGYRINDGEVFESRFETKAEVYKYAQKQYGKCVGKCYVGEGKHIGWIFQKLVRYEDSKEKYLQEVWITLHTAKPVRSIEYYYM